MIQFLDGPAAGVSLMLRRAPFMLRVVRKWGTNAWDALDQLDDVAKIDETIYAYRAAGNFGWVHIRASGGNGGRFMTGKYRVLAEQPEDSILRDNRAWAEWCDANRARLTEGREVAP